LIWNKIEIEIEIEMNWSLKEARKLSYIFE